MVSAGVCGYWVANARPMLDESTFIRRVYVSPWDNSTYEKHFYSIDWPAFSRWVCRGVFAVTGRRWQEFDDEHYIFDRQSPSYPGNIRLFDGERAPRGPVYVVRVVDACFLAMACAAAFFLGMRVVGSALGGLAAGLPFLFHPAAGQWLIGYIGTDAMLLFWMVAFVALWVRFHLSGTACTASRVMILAAVAGLAAATKINGGLLTVAFAWYLVARGKGRTRFLLAPAFCAVAFLVFVALNPVLWQPGGGGLVEGMKDIFARRADVMKNQEFLNPLPPISYFATRWALWPLIGVAGAALYFVRREEWLVPVSYWAVTVFAGSYFTLNRYDARLGFPLDAAVIIPTTLATLVVIRDIIRARRRNGKGAGSTGGAEDGGADGR